MSLSARRAWIEILMTAGDVTAPSTSLSARRAWIEITSSTFFRALLAVALRKESVDRNNLISPKGGQYSVALRKESVDRNDFPGSHLVRNARRSPQGERG